MELKIQELDVDIIQPNRSNMNNPEQGGSKIVIIGKPGCFKKNTKILLWSGLTKNVQEITTSDVVMGWDLTPRYIQYTCHGEETMFRVRYGKKKSVVVNERHVLTLYHKPTHRVIDAPVWEIHKDAYHQFLWIRHGWILSPLSIERVGYGEYYGFEVYGVDHHFLLADGSVVHNTGKCFAKNTEILMYDFSVRRVQDICVGDQVFGDDGTPRHVLGTARGRDFMYNIKQTCGKDYIVNSEHVLCLMTFDGTTKMQILCKDAYKDRQVLLQQYGGYRWPGMFTGDVEGLHNYSAELCRSLQIPYRSEEGRVEPLCFHTKHDPLVYSIDIVELEEDEYYGFEVDGNGRFCLADGTVTHNTTLITSLLYEKRHIFPAGIIMSGTEDSNSYYKRIIPSTFVYNRLDEKKIEDFIVRQKAAKKFVSNPWAVLLLDDCTDDPKLFNRSLFQGLYKNGRHWKMLFILSLQYCMDIKPVIRTNVDGVFILRETNLRNRKSLWENYAGVIPDFSMFCSIMDQITDNFTALYIHNATTSNKLEDCLFWYKAKDVPKNFRFGSRDLWKFHYNRYDQQYSDPIL